MFKDTGMPDDASLAIDKPSEAELLEKREKQAVSLLEGLGFSVSKRPAEQQVEGLSRQQLNLGRDVDASQAEFEPAGYYGAGKFVAEQNINGHNVTVAFTPLGSRTFDSGVFLDNKYIGGNHDFLEEELLIYVEKAMAAATFEANPGLLPTWTEEYKQFVAEFRGKVAEAKSANQ
ncbi:MAG: hypothetical protein WC227_01910 [Patescibacteria group bacterium]